MQKIPLDGGRQGWTVPITGAVPKAQVAVAVGSWSAALGYADDSGNFTISGYADPGNVGTTNELWTVGGALMNPSPLAITSNENLTH